MPSCHAIWLPVQPDATSFNSISRCVSFAENAPIASRPVATGAMRPARTAYLASSAALPASSLDIRIPVTGNRPHYVPRRRAMSLFRWPKAINRRTCFSRSVSSGFQDLTKSVQEDAVIVGDQGPGSLHAPDALTTPQSPAREGTPETRPLRANPPGGGSISTAVQSWTAVHAQSLEQRRAARPRRVFRQ